MSAANGPAPTDERVSAPEPDRVTGDYLYREALTAVTYLIAGERGEKPGPRHGNEARRLLHPILSDATRMRQVLR
jgi:hypothetical protein